MRLKDKSMQTTEITHYSSALSLMKFKSQGQGDCGRTGYISGYRAAINCKTCLKIYEEDKNKLLSATKL